MGGFFSKPKAPKTAKYIERPGAALMKDMPEYEKAAGIATTARISGIERALPGATAYRAQVLPELQRMTGRLDEQYQQLQPWQQRLVDEYAQVQGNKRLIEQQEQAVSKMISGELPPAVASQITRQIAERAGAGFAPAVAGRVGGFQTSQATLADQLRQSSEQRMLQGLQLAPSVTEQRRGLAATTMGLSEAQRGIAGTTIGLTEAQRGIQQTAQSWQNLAESFTYDPFESAAFAQPSQRYGETRARAMAQDFALQQEANEMFYNRMLGAAKFATNIIGGSKLGGGDQDGGGGGGGGGMDFFAAASKVFGKG